MLSDVSLAIDSHEAAVLLLATPRWNFIDMPYNSVPARDGLDVWGVRSM